MIRRLLAFLAFVTLGSLEAAAAAAGAPSLARRPAEMRDLRPAESPAATEATPVAADPALEDQVRRLAGGAATADAAFANALAGESPRVVAARGTAVSSEAWVVGQNAISHLDSLRDETVAALASLDSLRIERVNRGAVADVALIDPVRARLLAMVDAQNDRLDALKAQLKGP